MPISLLSAALHCVDAFYEIIFRAWPTAVTQATETYTLSYSGDIRLTGANHLWPRTSDALTAEALAAATRFFTKYGAAWSVIYTDAFMPDARTLLATHGFYRRWSSPLMVLDGPPQPLAINRLARPIRATAPPHLNDIARVMSDAFSTDGSTNRRIARPELLENPAITYYVLYEGSDPASCAAVARCGEMAGIWNVGTSPRFQRQRYATTIMAALLDDLRAEGCTATMLMASPSGQPLYDRLGYRQIAITSYMGPARHSRYSPMR